MHRLLGHRDARTYIIGQVFSLFGDTCLWLALGIWVKTITGSTAAAGLTFFFFAAATLLAPVTGLLADRFRRRSVLLANNIATAAAVLLLLFVHGAGQVWLIYAVMTLYGISYSVLGAAQSGLLAAMLPHDLLPDANGALRTVQEGLRLIGPLTGAALFISLGPHAVVTIDAATFVAAILSLLLLRVREADPPKLTRRWRSEVTAGLSHVSRTLPLRQLVIACAISTTVFGFIETVTYAIVGNGLHRRPAFVGVLVAVQGLGAIIGGLTAGRLVRRLNERWLVVSGLLAAAAGVLLELPPTLVSVVSGFVLFGMGIPWIVIGLITLGQRVTPLHLQGRVYAAVDMLVTIPQTVSIALGAGLIVVTGYQALLAAMAVVMSFAAGFLVFAPAGAGSNPQEPSTVAGSDANRAEITSGVV